MTADEISKHMGSRLQTSTIGVMTTEEIGRRMSSRLQTSTIGVTTFEGRLVYF